jgi:hypothetical protein
VETNHAQLAAKERRKLKRKYFFLGAFSIAPIALLLSLLIGDGPPVFSPKSAPIDWKTEGKDMMDRYKNHRKRFRTKDPKDSTDVVTLDAVRFDADHLDKLINYAAGKKAKFVYLYFGIDKKKLDGDFLRSHPIYHVITVAADYDNSGKLNLLTGQAYNKTDPCPDKCPDIIQ